VSTASSSSCRWPGCEVELTLSVYKGNSTYQRKYCDEHLRMSRRKYALERGMDRRFDARGNILLRREKDGKTIWVREHREVMEKFLGRPLREGEDVLHKNGNRQDNGLDNLLLRTILSVDELWRLTVTQNATDQGTGAILTAR
jgi:hypothetical protein